ncbi:hypothetical protein AB0M35_20720 [Micromonospora sp. NPDC051196]|uniref:hypothetical protein n=1 Tax=Micromonospora sp. NPDC051196 TaxID=3155281 RepID=UPI0034270D41
MGYGVRDDVIGRHLDQVRRSGGLCVAAHPHAPYPSGTLMYPYDWFDVVEVWNGCWASDLPWNADNEAALAPRIAETAGYASAGSRHYGGTESIIALADNNARSRRSVGVAR